jgi:spore photoproduct lyase
MLKYRPERVLVQSDSYSDDLTAAVLSRLPGVPVQTVDNPESVLSEIQTSSDPRTSGKRTLLLARHKGAFLKPCPGSGAEICCNYYVLNFASNCHIECTYCVLQTFLNNPVIAIFTNWPDLAGEVREKLAAAPSTFFRIGTGETADSLALDELTGYSRLLVPLFAPQPNAILELKTKSDAISNLEGLDHRGKTVVSWSVNPRRICAAEELKAATLDERLRAARAVQRWGYPIGFHFDPIVWYEGWEPEYRDAVREILSAVDPSRIAWISLGALRFTPRLREVVRRRFPKSKVPSGEFVPAHHGKLRYFRPIREEMYARMNEWIREAAPGVLVYLCMESRLVWERSLGAAPADTADLSGKLDARVAPGKADRPPGQ